MPRSLFSILTLLMLVTFPALAADEPVRSDFEAWLLPVNPQVPFAGGYGSRWIADCYVRNESDEAVVFSVGRPSCNLPSCTYPDPLFQLRPHETQRFDTTGNFGIETVARSGVMVYVEKEHADDVPISLRIWEESRGGFAGSTDIPVVRQAAVHPGPVTLLNVPLARDLARTMLRVYHVADEPAEVIVVVRVFDLEGTNPLYETVLSLANDLRLYYDFPVLPGYAELPDLEQIEALTGVDRVRIEIEPLTEGARLWAFASITNNQTQHVTIATPQPR